MSETEAVVGTVATADGEVTRAADVGMVMAEDMGTVMALDAIPMPNPYPDRVRPRAVPLGLVNMLAQEAGVDPDDVLQLVVRPNSATFTCILRDEMGQPMSVGHGGDVRDATMVVEVPVRA
jgi:hypothetical protein